MLIELYSRGPDSEGIFRKPPNIRQVREYHNILDNGGFMDMAETNIAVIGALMKEFLRSLPDCLLDSNLFNNWVEITRESNKEERIFKTVQLCSRLPQSNFMLLQYLLCIFHEISIKSSKNLMTASNLAICISPSLLWPPQRDNEMINPVAMMIASETVEFLINNISYIFGDRILHIFTHSNFISSSDFNSNFQRDDWRRKNRLRSVSSCNTSLSNCSFETLHYISKYENPFIVYV